VGGRLALGGSLALEGDFPPGGSLTLEQDFRGEVSLWGMSGSITPAQAGLQLTTSRILSKIATIRLPQPVILHLIFLHVHTDQIKLKEYLAFNILSSLHDRYVHVYNLKPFVYLLRMSRTI
jgi:hypothetical protein